MIKNLFEWYTPTEYIEAARAAMGGIDLDPASSELAQRRVRASEFYSFEKDGLSRPWGGRVFLNPPYARNVHPVFIRKLLAEFSVGRVTEAILFLNNNTDAKWFQNSMGASSAICFPKGRIRCLDPEGRKANVTQGQAFIYLGSRPEAFKAEFGKFGFIGRVFREPA